jgi:7-keto-8-aminopelargonate synthetase-like enzyme
MAHAMGFTASAHPDLGGALATVTQTARALIFGSLYLAGVALASNGSFPH